MRHGSGVGRRRWATWLIAVADTTKYLDPPLNTARAREALTIVAEGGCDQARFASDVGGGRSVELSGREVVGRNRREPGENRAKSGESTD